MLIRGARTTVLGAVRATPNLTISECLRGTCDNAYSAIMQLKLIPRPWRSGSELWFALWNLNPPGGPSVLSLEESSRAPPNVHLDAGVKRIT